MGIDFGADLFEDLMSFRQVFVVGPIAPATYTSFPLSLTACFAKSAAFSFSSSSK